MIAPEPGTYIWFTGVVTGLAQLLETNFVQGQTHNYLTRYMVSANENFVAGQQEAFEVRTWQLIHLGLDLMVVREAHPAIYRRLKPALLAASEETYAGARFELYLAAKLTRAGVAFETPARPDFHLPGFGVFVECTIVKTAAAGSGPLTRKIVRAIRRKSARRYTARPLVLSIDATNIMRHVVLRGGRTVALPDYRLAIKQELNRSPFEAVLVCTYTDHVSRGSFGYGFHRFQKPSASPEVRRFLNEIYPRDRQHRKVFSYAIPNLA